MLSALIAGAGLYYLQVYGYYTAVPQDEEVTLVSLTTQQPEPIVIDGFQGIDADSSPIRYRGCFETTLSLAAATETYHLLDQATPRNAPAWFECFDAPAIAAELQAGTALPFLSAKNVHYGVDRIVAITEDGRGYIWHELNDCGEKSYDGTVIGEDCPARPAQ